MIRTFSIVRRRSHIVDLITPIQTGVDQYRLKWAENFDAPVWAPFVTASTSGHLDVTINRAVLHDVPGSYVRIVFDPTNYGIEDNKTFWLKFVPVVGGVEGTESPPTMILSESTRRTMGLVLLEGEAPAGLTVADALQIDLPGSMRVVNVHNEDAAVRLCLATEAGGTELRVNPNESRRLYGGDAAQMCILVRGEGASVRFSAPLTFL